MTNPTEPMAVERDGRRIAVHQVADGQGPPVVFLHAAPGAGPFDPGPAETRRRQLTLWAPDRPGYGQSDPVAAGQWATVSSAADDAAAALDELGLEGVGAVGWSAGGRVALALAARRPDLVARVAVVATPAPDDQVPWIPEPIRQGLEQLRGTPSEQVHAVLTEQMGAMADVDPRTEAAVALVGDPAVDSAALAVDGVRDSLATMFEATFRQGAAGLVADVAGYCLQPWGFDPADVAVPVLLAYGARDEGVGPAHGEWWRDQLPQAELEVTDDAGHLVVVPAWPRVLDHLLAA